MGKSNFRSLINRKTFIFKRSSCEFHSHFYDSETSEQQKKQQSKKMCTKSKRYIRTNSSDISYSSKLNSMTNFWRSPNRFRDFVEHSSTTWLARTIYLLILSYVGPYAIHWKI